MINIEREGHIPADGSAAVLRVVVEDAGAMERELARAVERVRAAIVPGTRQGILVTRLGRSLFAVESSAEVPFGETVDRDRWDRGTTSDTAEQLGVITGDHGRG